MDFHKEALLFLDDLFARLDAAQVEIADYWDIDHLCYRVENIERYGEMKEGFSHLGTLLAETEVNGRPIATYRLNKAIPFRHWLIELVELPAPKLGKKVKEGFEHIEVVVDQSFEEIRENWPAGIFKESGLNKEFNRELAMLFNGLTVKFHHLGLDSVIRLENFGMAAESLEELQFYSKFSGMDPTIVGTIPLGIHTEQSDIDILFKGGPKWAESLELVEYLSREEGFETFVVEKELGSARVIRFIKNAIPFELFIQDRSPFKQRGFQHFQIEERLLKWKGENFRRLVCELRAEGLKTEPAFAKVLGLPGNPYTELLKLTNLSGRELSDLIPVS
jgi:predicted metalloenzyme YecM